MPTWIVLTAAATIVVTGALTWVLWRLNQGAEGEAPRRESASDLAIVASDIGADKPKAARGGSGDGGGD